MAGGAGGNHEDRALVEGEGVVVGVNVSGGISYDTVLGDDGLLEEEARDDCRKDMVTDGRGGSKGLRGPRTRGREGNGR